MGLGVAAALLGVAVSIGVWLFNQAFTAIHDLTFNTIGGMLQPIGAWTIALIPALGGIGAALAYALARKFQPGSAYTFALTGAGLHLKAGTFSADTMK